NKPIGVKLYDSLNNKSAYMRWYKGQLKTIVSPTENHVYNLGYDNSFNNFTYVEENFNLPPRLVSKKIGESKTVLYQSNNNDKESFHLKREIVSYTNSEGVPLKGVLF